MAKTAFKKRNTKKRPRSTSSGRPRRKSAAERAAVVSGNGKANEAGTHDDPSQQYIPGTEPPKIATLDEHVEKYTKHVKSANSQKEKAKSVLGKIEHLMDEHKLDKYKTQFGDVSIQHGVTVVKVKLPKER